MRKRLDLSSPRVRRGITLSTVALVGTWLAWLTASGALAEEVRFRQSQFASKPPELEQPPYATVSFRHVGIDKTLPTQSLISDSAAFNDSSLIVVAGSASPSLERLRQYIDRLTSHYRLPVRLTILTGSKAEVHPLAAHVGFPPQSPMLLVIKGTDSLAFRSSTLLSPDELREILGFLYPSPDHLRPMVDESAVAWDQAFRTAHFTIDGQPVSGASLLGEIQHAVVLAAECSACRIGEHLRRLKEVGLDTAASAVIVAPAQYAQVLRDSMPQARMVALVNDLQVVSALALVSRDVAAADPVLLVVRGRAVTAVNRLRGKTQLLSK